jgi:hypothetical protein
MPEELTVPVNHNEISLHISSSFALLSEKWRKRSSTLQMSGQRSDWRERLHANPSRMEQELAINLRQDQIRRTITVFCRSAPQKHFNVTNA